MVLHTIPNHLWLRLLELWWAQVVSAVLPYCQYWDNCQCWDDYLAWMGLALYLAWEMQSFRWLQCYMLRILRRRTRNLDSPPSIYPRLAQLVAICGEVLLS